MPPPHNHTVKQRRIAVFGPLRIERAKPTTPRMSAEAEPTTDLAKQLEATQLKCKDLRTGLVYDERCLLHCSKEGTYHPESPRRMSASMNALTVSGVLDRCTRIEAIEITNDELQLREDRARQRHVGKMERLTKLLQKASNGKVSTVQLDGDTYFNKHTLAAARISCGGLLRLTREVHSGRLDNGFAVVRPPGHHASMYTSSGFCILNNVSVVVRAMQQENPGIRIAIVDTDIHFGNGTYRDFKRDPDVLFFSIHRHDHGEFYPGTGHAKQCGKGGGLGRKINVALNSPGYGDGEYLHVFQHLLIPVLGEFRPHLIVVSAGFDCAANDPNSGEMLVSTQGFAHMTHVLLKSAQALGARMVMALEGGYGLPAVAAGITACVRVLLGEEPAPLAHPHKDVITIEQKRDDNNVPRLEGMLAMTRAIGRTMEVQASFLQDFEQCMEVQRKYWNVLLLSQETKNSSEGAASSNATSGAGDEEEEEEEKEQAEA
jgi:acetoin utilization deacetylase AcuC-like enzyme